MIGTLVIGLAAGVLAGLFGVGAGALIVPALMLFSGLSQVDAEATSLLALVPVFSVGAWRQDRYGNVRRHDAAVISALSVAGAVVGVVLANALPQRVLELAFAALLTTVALQLAHQQLRKPASPEDRVEERRP